jgi:hypothetical protein
MLMSNPLASISRDNREETVKLVHEVMMSMPSPKTELVTIIIRHEDGRLDEFLQRVQQGQCLVVSIGGVR